MYTVSFQPTVLWQHCSYFGEVLHNFLPKKTCIFSCLFAIHMVIYVHLSGPFFGMNHVYAVFRE